MTGLGIRRKPARMAVTLGVMLLVVAAAGLWAFPSGAGSAEPAPGQAPLSLEQAKELCRRNSALTAMADAQLDRAVLEDEEARLVADEISEDMITSYEAAAIVYLQPEQAAVERKLAERKVEAVGENLDLQVTRAYTGVISARRFVSLAEAAADRAADQVAVTDRLYQAGMAAYKDVLDARAREAEARSGVVSAQKGARLAELGLLRLIGGDLAELPPLDAGDVLGDTATGIDQFDIDQCVELAKARRYEAVSTREYLALAELNLELARTYPSGGLPLDLIVELPGIELPPDWSYEPSWERSERYTIPLAEAQLQEAWAGYVLQLEELEFQVRGAGLDVWEAAEKAELYGPAVRAAEEGLRLARLRYQAGMATGLEVAVADLAYSNAQTEYQQALYQHRLAVAALRHASGRGSTALFPGTAHGMQGD